MTDVIGGTSQPTAQPVTVALANPAVPGAPTVLYLTDDPDAPSQNALTLQITNGSDSSWVLAAGGSCAVWMSFDGLIDHQSVSGFAVEATEPAGSEWTSSVVDDDEYGWNLVIAPSADATIGAGSVLEFAISDIVIPSPPNAATSNAVRLELDGFPGVTEDNGGVQFFPAQVTEPPAPDQLALTDVVVFAVNPSTLYVTVPTATQQSLDVVVALKTPGSGLVPSSSTWPSTPTIALTIPSGPGSGNLTTDADTVQPFFSAKNWSDVRTGSDGFWPTWSVEAEPPTGPGDVLGTAQGDSLTFSFSGITPPAASAGGGGVVYVTWSGIPGYVSGTAVVPVDVRPGPEIVTFAASRQAVTENPNEVDVTLEWDVENAGSVSWGFAPDNGETLNDQAQGPGTIPVAVGTEITLSGFGLPGPEPIAVSASVTVSGPVVTQLAMPEGFGPVAAVVPAASSSKAYAIGQNTTQNAFEYAVIDLGESVALEPQPVSAVVQGAWGEFVAGADVYGDDPCVLLAMTPLGSAANGFVLAVRGQVVTGEVDLQPMLGPPSPTAGVASPSLLLADGLIAANSADGSTLQIAQGPWYGGGFGYWASFTSPIGGPCVLVGAVSELVLLRSPAGFTVMQWPDSPGSAQPVDSLDVTAVYGLTVIGHAVTADCSRVYLVGVPATSSVEQAQLVVIDFDTTDGSVTSTRIEPLGSVPTIPGPIALSADESTVYVVTDGTTAGGSYEITALDTTEFAATVLGCVTDSDSSFTPSWLVASPIAGQVLATGAAGAPNDSVWAITMQASPSAGAAVLEASDSSESGVL